MRLALIVLPLALLATPPAFAGDAPKAKVVCTTSAPSTGSRLGQRKCVAQKVETPEKKVAARPAAKPAAKATTHTAKR